jgi:hypothetical protein
MRYTFLVEALLALSPNHGFSIDGENELGNVTWINTPSPMPTDEEIITKCEALQTEYDAQEYARNRELEYPTVQELVVALYDEDDKAAIEAKRAEIKAKYPKPE